MKNIENKVVVITGASSGIGEATARKLAGLGANVVLGARREDRLRALVESIKGSGGQAAYKVTDVTRREDVDALIQTAIENFGGVDVLVNNAGLMPMTPLKDRRYDEWDKAIDINLKGVLYGIGAVLPEFYRKKRAMSFLSHPLPGIRRTTVARSTRPPSLACEPSWIPCARKPQPTGP